MNGKLLQRARKFFERKPHNCALAEFDLAFYKALSWLLTALILILGCLLMWVVKQG